MSFEEFFQMFSEFGEAYMQVIIKKLVLKNFEQVFGF